MVSDSPLAPAVKASGTSRWFWSKAWVAEPRRTSVTLPMSAACAVPIVTVCPYDTEVGALEISGRGPRKRYGGEKISALRSLAAPAPSPEPVCSTRASGSRIDVEWYIRITLLLASVLHRSVPGLQS